MVDPNRLMFLGIGAQKCASTWLHDILSDHPEVCLPSEAKEVDFFSFRYDYGFQWYERQFELAPGSKVYGEISPSYFHDIAAPHRVAAYNADALVIAILREPVARLISNHRHEVRTGHFRGPDLSLESGLRNNPAYIEQGKYATHLERWFSVLPRDQFMLVIFDDILARPEEVARRVYRFLKIDDRHLSRSFYRKSNESYVHRSRWLDAGKKKLWSGFRNVGLKRAWKFIGDAGLRKAYRKLNRQPPDNVIPAVDPSTIVELKEIFSDEVARLENILGISLERWR